MFFLTVHELIHGLGFIHTQSRPDRDQFVKILWDNIEGKFKSQYEMCSSEHCKLYKELPYECDSIMHYFDGLFGYKGKFLYSNLSSKSFGNL